MKCIFRASSETCRLSNRFDDNTCSIEYSHLLQQFDYLGLDKESWLVFMADLFSEPSAEQRAAKSGLIGKRISLWWDGDAVFFPAKVIDFDEKAGIHNVRYDNDDTHELYPETLSKQPWKIWSGGEEDFKTYNKIKVEVTKMTTTLHLLDMTSDSSTSLIQLF